MLYLNLTGDAHRLAGTLRRLCEMYGTVLNVWIDRSVSPCATVEMATHMEAILARLELGDAMSGCQVTIALGHKLGIPSVVVPPRGIVDAPPRAKVELEPENCHASTDEAAVEC